MSNLNILIIEDEPNLGETLLDYLEGKKHTVKLAQTAQEAREIFISSNYPAQVVLMDIGLPDGDGIELAQEFRSHRKNYALIFLSALNDPDTKFRGLEIGGDDYITKPFDLRELNLRLDRILKTKDIDEEFEDEIKLGPLRIWFKRFEVQCGNGTILSLSQKEAGILQLLYTKKNEVISRDEIIEKIWGANSFPSNRTVDNYIVKLRKWIDTANSELLVISSIRGIGYRLEIK